MKKIICIENPDWECFTLYISEVETSLIMPKKIAVNGSDLYYFNNIEESKKLVSSFDKINHQSNCADEFVSIVEEKVNQCTDNLLDYLSSIVNRKESWVLPSVNNLCKRNNIPLYVENDKYSILYKGNYYTAMPNSDIGFLCNEDWKAIGRIVTPATKIYE